MNLRNSIYIIFFFALGFSLNAQDVHFSQFHQAPLWLNPALGGVSKGDARIIVNYRNQWQSVTKPFQTFGGSFEINTPSFGRCDYFNIGLSVISDRAGDSNFQTTFGHLSLSFQKSLSGSGKKNYLGIGLLVGGNQTRFDPSKLFFDNQFNGADFDTGLSSGENFARTSYFNFDIGAGLSWNFVPNEILGFTAGAAMYHLNQPNVSFLGDDGETLYVRSSLHASAYIRFGEDSPLSVHPRVVGQFQGPHREINVGALIGYALEPQNIDEGLVLYLGGYMRFQDAVSPIVKIEYKQLSAGFSYDLNISKLSQASNYNGAMEFSVIYTPKLYGDRECAYIFCPAL